MVLDLAGVGDMAHIGTGYILRYCSLDKIKVCKAVVKE
jgi:hypothetical protein